MKFTIALFVVTLLVSCNNQSENEKQPKTMDSEKIKAEVQNAENELLGLLRSGEIKKGVAMHRNTKDYRNIWSGEIKTREMLEERINMGLEAGLKAFDYQVKSREFMIIDSMNVMETLTAIPVSVMVSGDSIADPLTTISILWQKAEGKWWVGYLHASEWPKEN